MADDRIIPPPLAPALHDLLKPTERDLLRLIVETGDLIDGFKGRLLGEAFGLHVQPHGWLLVPLSPAAIDMLAAFEADLADLEDDEREPDVDDEPSLGSLTNGSQERTWRASPVGVDLEGDGDGREADLEPSLGATEARPDGWSWITRGESGVMEEEQDILDQPHDEEGDEPSLGATEAINQAHAWRVTSRLSDGEAQGTEDDLEMPLPTIAEQDKKAELVGKVQAAVRAIVRKTEGDR